MDAAATREALKLLLGGSSHKTPSPTPNIGQPWRPAKLGEAVPVPEQSLEEQVREVVRGAGGRMPSEAATVGGDETREWLSQVVREASAAPVSRFADNFERLLSLCSALLNENENLKIKMDGLVQELFKATVLKPTTGINLAGRNY